MDEKDKLVIEIIQLAYLVQRYTDFCIFIRYSGHVDALEIDIRQSVTSWQTEVLKTEITQIYREYYQKGDCLRDLKSKRDILLKIIHEHDVPYEDVDVEQYLVEQYSF